MHECEIFTFGDIYENDDKSNVSPETFLAFSFSHDTSSDSSTYPKILEQEVVRLVVSSLDDHFEHFDTLTHKLTTDVFQHDVC